MSLTPEQLMIPRVMCIGTEVGKKHYPRSAYETGQILVLVNGWYVNHKRPKRSYPYSVDEVLYYPHLFRKMPWYEGRKPEEMPYFLKYSDTGRIHKIDNYYIDPIREGNITIEFGGNHTRLNEKWLPADESEYLEYQNSKK